MAHACIFTSVHPADDTRIFHRQARSLAGAGFTVTLLATRGTAAASSSLPIKVIPLPAPKRRLGRIVNWWRFLQRTLQVKADIYHFHDPDLLVMAPLLRLLSGKPVIYDCHEPYRQVMLEREYIPARLRHAIGLFVEKAEKLLARLVSAVVVANPPQARHFFGALLVANYPQLGEHFDLDAQPAYHSARIVHLGVMSMARGLPELVEAVASMTPSPAKLVLMGKYADAETEQAVQSLIKSHNLAGIIDDRGVTPYLQAIQTLGSAAVGVVPYRATPALVETVPTKLFEYMACGLPVVVSDLPLTTPVLQAADCGLVVPPGDVAALAKALSFLLENPDEARRLGQNGRAAVLSTYNWEREAEKLVRLYHQLLGNTRATSKT
jgi:glycosyltransferase involved in cell wall biosynthesis